MALQVWLPLNGSMENQGLLNLTPTQQGTISWIDGKIGKCLSAGNANQTANGISYDSNLTAELGTEFSAAVWVKPLGNHVHYNGTFVSSGNWNAKRWAFGVNQYNSQVDVFGQGHNTYINCSVPVNTWTHLCCVHQGTTVKLYKNGEYIGEKTNVPEELDSDATNFCVGRETYANGYFSFNGNLNDLRIYDHALSLKEIKELAKGLVLHYKLNDLNTDYENIMFDCSGYNYNGSIIGTLIASTDTPKYSNSVYSSNGAEGRIVTPELIFPNNTITLNIWFKSTNTSPTGNYHMIIDSVSNRLWYEICINNTGFFRSGLTINGTRNAENIAVTEVNCLDGQWHMLTITYNGIAVKRYVDGILRKTTNVAIDTGLSSPTALSIFRDGPNGNYACKEVYLSDFRIYATALSEEDISELYHTAASIDNQGNLFCGEVVE